MTTDEQHVADDGPDDDQADAIPESEGVGGIPGLDPGERATVSDVDGDNVETEHPKPEA